MDADRAVYRLIGLVRQYGPGPVDTACAKALDVDVIAIGKIASMLAKATENTPALLPAVAPAGAPRFARDPSEYATGWTTPAGHGTGPVTGTASAGTTPEARARARLTVIPGGAAAMKEPVR